MSSSYTDSLQSAGRKFATNLRELVTPAVWIRLEQPVLERSAPLFVYLAVTIFFALDWGLVEVLGWILGVFLGWWFLDIDHVVDALWIHPNSPVGREVRSLLGRNEWRKAFILLFDTRAERKSLVLHSIVFQGLVLLLGLYVVTSTSLMLAKGILLGLWGRMVFEQIRVYLKKGNMDYWLWQIKDSVPTSFQAILLVSEVVVLVWLTLMAV